MLIMFALLLAMGVFVRVSVRFRGLYRLFRGLSCGGCHFGSAIFWCFALGVDNPNVLRHVGRLLDGRTGSSPIELVNDGDLLLLIWTPFGLTTTHHNTPQHTATRPQQDHNNTNTTNNTNNTNSTNSDSDRQQHKNTTTHNTQRTTHNTQQHQRAKACAKKALAKGRAAAKEWAAMAMTQGAKLAHRWTRRIGTKPQLAEEVVSRTEHLHDGISFQDLGSEVAERHATLPKTLLWQSRKSGHVQRRIRTCSK